jgi:hypothetical protein
MDGFQGFAGGLVYDGALDGIAQAYSVCLGLSPETAKK